MSKKNTSGMKDMFEQAKQDIIEHAKQEIKEKEEEIKLYSGDANEYDSGNETAEDRNIRNGLENDIRNIETIRDKKLAELTIETVKQK